MAWILLYSSRGNDLYHGQGYLNLMDVVFISGIIDAHKKNFRPFGTHQLAWYLRKNGYQTQVINYVQHAPEKLIKEALTKYITPKTKVVGLGIMSNGTELGIVLKKIESVLYWVKRTYPHVKIIAGGPLTNHLVRKYRNKMLFDYLFYGHGENTLLELCDHLYTDKNHPKTITVQGNTVIQESDANPERSHFKIENSSFEWSDNDFIQENESLPLELGRGCVFSCRFCSYPYIGKKVNDFNRSMECIEQELLRNYEKWKVTSYMMLDDTINASEERNLQFWQMTQRLPFKIKFAGYCRMDLLAKRPESEAVLFESGLRGVYFGLETFNQQAANLIKKGWNATHAKDYLPRLNNDLWKRQVGIQVGMIAGLPPETFEELKESNRWMIANEINHWKWHRLGINREKNSLFISEFDRNAEQYGFDWYVDNGKLYWKTEHATQRDAEEWVSDLTAEASSHYTYACWSLLELAQYDFDIQYMMKIPIKKNDLMPEIARRRKTFIRNYWSQLLNRPVKSIDFIG